jgi:hypothetical protein
MKILTAAAFTLALALAATAPTAADPPAAPAAGPRMVLDDFSTTARWTSMPADGVEMRLSTDTGPDGGPALRVDFRFVRGGGYAVLHRALDVALPDNYRFTFRVRGDCPSENLELKLIDSSGANVWWRNQRDFRFPRAWQTVTVRKRQISFAWGPAGGGELRHVAALEFAITAGSGGSGTVWLDELALEPLPVAGAAPPVVAAATTARGGHEARLAVDGDAESAWVCEWGDAAPALTLDLGGPRELGGLVVDRAREARGAAYAVELSDDGASWRVARTIGVPNRDRDAVDLPECETRFVRLRRADGTKGPLGFREVRVMPLEWSESPNAFLRAVAKDAPRGVYPRGLLGEPSAWAVVGVDGGRDEGLLGADGALETGQGAWSVEPFLWDGGRLVSWADAVTEVSLEDGDLPIPSVSWRRGDLQLTVTAFADGPADSATLVARYRVRNVGGGPLAPTLYLAVRPFQVNPPEQFLAVPGGAAPIRAVFADGPVVRVNGDRGLVSLTAPDGFGAVASPDGDVVADYLRANVLPARAHATDSLGRASAALAYRLSLEAGAEAEVDVVVPFEDRPEPPSPPGAERTDAEWRGTIEARQAACRAAWRGRTGTLALRLPGDGADVARAVTAQSGWIRVNRDGAGIQPGSRSYARTWIRDGSLTSAALLRMGEFDVVRDFIDWFAPYQYADGKVPCCVDQRGSDPVPEHDSGGEFVWLVAEYYRHTGDRALVERRWDAVARAAAYLDSLRGLRRTPAWRAAGRGEFYGLLPPSISHEGYSAQPMHSYWDDLFALRGFADAAFLAGVLGRDAEAARWSAARDTFARDLLASIAACQRVHGVDYVPGCADLGDFDATSTTIALDPVQAAGLPRAALEHTFERYWEFFRDRAAGAKWENFTPYEMRTIGAFARLGWRDRADSLLAWFMTWRRPPGWQQWAEVAWSDPRTPHFIGDLPHTWVGSDFVRSVLDLLAYERESDQALVLAAGVPLRWVQDLGGMSVSGLHTRWGAVAYAMRSRGSGIEARIEAGPTVPPGGVVLRAPGAWRRVTVNGAKTVPAEDGSIVLRALPATVVLRP